MSPAYQPWAVPEHQTTFILDLWHGMQHHGIFAAWAVLLLILVRGVIVAGHKAVDIDYRPSVGIRFLLLCAVVAVVVLWSEYVAALVLGASIPLLPWLIVGRAAAAVLGMFTRKQQIEERTLEYAERGAVYRAPRRGLPGGVLLLVLVLGIGAWYIADKGKQQETEIKAAEEAEYQHGRVIREANRPPTPEPEYPSPSKWDDMTSRLAAGLPIQHLEEHRPWPLEPGGINNPLPESVAAPAPADPPPLHVRPAPAREAGGTDYGRGGG